MISGTKAIMFNTVISLAKQNVYNTRAASTYKYNLHDRNCDKQNE